MSSAPPTKLNLAIVHLEHKDQLSRFTCGDRDIDGWAQKKAFKLHSNGRHKVYIAREVDGFAPVAFYSLSLNHQSSAKLLEQNDRDAWQNGAPFLYLDWLAVLRSQQGLGIGRLMLGDAIHRALHVWDVAPVYGLALRSLNERTTKFYSGLGFRMAPDEERAQCPLMILPIFTIRDLIGIS